MLIMLKLPGRKFFQVFALAFPKMEFPAASVTNVIQILFALVFYHENLYYFLLLFIRL